MDKLLQNKLFVDLIGPYKRCRKENQPNNYHTSKAIISELEYQKVYITQRNEYHDINRKLCTTQLRS